MQFLQRLFKVHIASKSGDRVNYLGKFAFGFEILFIALFTIVTLVIIPFFVYPFYVYHTENKLISIMPMFIWGIDETEPFGYTILAIAHTIIIMSGVVGLLACDYFLAVMIISPLMFAKLIALEIDEIHSDMHETETASNVSARFRNVLQMHQEVIE